MKNIDLYTWSESGMSYEDYAEQKYYAADSGIYTEQEEKRIIALEKIIAEWLNNPDQVEAEGSGCDICIEINEITAPLGPHLQKYAL